MSEADYEALGTSLDAANGFPAGVGTKAVTLTTLPPLDRVEKDAGRVYLTLSSHDNRLIDADAYAAHADEIEEATEWVQPTGSTDAYPVGAFVIWQNRVYLNYLPNNVWRPDVAGWRDPRDVPTWFQPVAAPDAWPLDAVVFHNSKKWRSNHPANVWEPGATGVRQWDDVTETPPSTGTPEWEAGVSYSIGDVVIYQGNDYECRQAHTSIGPWTPTAVPALWLAL
jgi:hypothetical protein